MNVPQILIDLVGAEGLPREALHAATEHRSELVPLFIEAFDKFVPDGDGAQLLFFGFHLLGQWRETTAYRPLCRFLRRMGDDIDAVMGDDAMTETAHRVMAAVFDGDPAPLYDVIHDERVNEYVRSGMCTALAMLTARGDLPRAEMQRFLREAFDRLKPRRGCFVWAGWEDAIVRLGMVELMPLLETACRRGSVDSSWSTFAEAEAALASAVTNGCADIAGGDTQFTLFGDAIEEFASWYGFSEQVLRERAKARQEQALSALAPVAQTAFGVDDEVPRKALCPCGSGRKFKHCHGRMN